MAKLSRNQLAEVFHNHEMVKAFEKIDESVDSTFPAQIAQAQLTANNARDLATGQALGVFEPRERVLSLRPGDGVVVTPDAAGYVFSLDLGFVINAAKAFLSRSFQVTAEAIRYALGYTPAPTDSPNFTGIPTAPTAAAGTNTTQIATTAHVFAERTNAATLTNKTISLANNTLTATSAQLAASLTDETGTGAAVFAGSPAFTGTPTAPTAAFGTDTTQIATTAFVQDVVTGPAFSAYQSSTQSLPSAVYTKVRFQTEEFDTNSNFDSTTNYRFTPTVAGYYQIDAGVLCPNLLLVGIFKNGAEFKRGTLLPSGAAGDTDTLLKASALIQMNGTTDYLEIFAYQTNAASRNINANSAYTYFQGFLARAA